MTHRTRSLWQNLLIVGVVSVGLAGGAYLYFRSLGAKELTPLEAAQVIPQEAIATSFIATDASHWSKLQQFGTPEIQNLVTKNLQTWQSEIFEDTTINYEQDIQPWLSGVMIAFLPPNPSSSSVTQSENLLLIVGIKNKLKAMDFFNKLKGQKDQQVQEVSHQGVTIYQLTNKDNESFNFAALDNYLIVATEQKTIERAIDTNKGLPSYAEKAGIKEALSRQLLLKNTLAQVYLPDSASAIKQVLKNTLEVPDLPTTTLKELQQIKSVVIGVGVEDQGIHVQAVAQLNSDSIQPDLNPSSGDILYQFPGNTIALISGQGIQAGWSNLVEQALKDPDSQLIVDQVRQSSRKINLDADRDVFGWLDGEFALGLVASEQENFSNLEIGVAILLETSDRSTSQATLAKLNQAAQTLPFIFVNQSKVQDTEITQWSVSQENGKLTYGWLDDRHLLVTLGTSFSEVKNTQAKTSLAENDTFKYTTELLPQKNFGYFYLDLEQALSKINTLPAMRENVSSPETMVVLNPIRGIAVTATMPDRTTSQLDIMLSLKRLPEK